MMSRIELWLIGCFFASNLHAQAPRWSASIPEVKEAGVYAITLSPELQGGSRTDLGDIRLLDSTGADVPYVLRTVLRAGDKGQFEPFDLVRNEVLQHSTVIELERPADEVLDELHIWIRPSDTEKRVRITGSDDRSNWYMVKDEHLVAQGARGDPPHQVLLVRLPRSDYRYFRLSLNDSLTAPMKVLGVGRFSSGHAAGREFVQVGPLEFIRKDSAGETRLLVMLPASLLAERIAFRVADTVAFRRDVRIESQVHGTMRKGRHTVPTNWKQVVARGAIASDRDLYVDLPATQLDTFRIVVSNGDDRPLQFTELHALAGKRVLLARLEPGVRYRLSTGDPALASPRYDMAHFAEDLPAPLDTLRHAAPVAAFTSAEAGPLFDPAQAWVWVAILALLILMGWMAARMLRKT